MVASVIMIIVSGEARMASQTVFHRVEVIIVTLVTTAITIVRRIYMWRNHYMDKQLPVIQTTDRNHCLSAKIQNRIRENYNQTNRETYNIRYTNNH